ncbi:MAG TPA: NAD(P)H-quinone oxidoreductase [Rhodocyclaceae bacterium]|jgi:putative PIG3 family NAD(P)H quinone oxidoreductase|nr:NAD(P)H-quinone oxidoreductase [Rhodocyclaceae bacterium]
MRFIDHGQGGEPSTLKLADGPQPVPKAGEILIEVHYAGVNRPDVVQRQGKYPPPAGASPVLGLEVAGRVAALGDGVAEWQVGDQVSALTPGGGYAEYCTAPASNALPIPPGLTLAEAAALPENWFTVWANLKDMCRLKAGERLLVHGGSGGIGLAAIQLGKLTGCEVFTTVGNDEKAAACRAIGADHVINYRQADFKDAVRSLTQDQGVDVVLDMVGGSYVQKNLSVLRKDGRLSMIAFLEGSKGEVDLMPVMLKRLTITGSTLRPRSVAEKSAIRDALREQVWPALADGRIKPRIHAVFPLAEADKAHELMESSRHIGKILLQVK